MPIADPDRPDADLLLAQIQQDEAKAKRGALRIYFGASAGVGKTYAMLAAARKLKEDGRDVVVGVAETHGRAETAALLEGLQVLPPKELEYRGNRLKEFDLNAAIARSPELVLVDELAHTNVPGSRHPKRWQDVEELLASGISIFTTLNVQHLESLNDVVGGITGIRVWETLPDTFFDRADEIVLVDVSADELLGRLKAGKVYIPEQAERAAHHFFRKGNLIALREIALRRTADRLEEDVQSYRQRQAIERVWKTEASLLCCIGPQPGGEQVVRSTARLATQLNVDWTAVYVETPTLQRLPSARRERILKTLKLAQELGADTAVLPGSDAPAAVIEYARSHNVSKIILGRPRPPRLYVWRIPFDKRLASAAPDIDFLVIGRGEAAAAPALGEIPESAAALPAKSPIQRFRYVLTAAACVVPVIIGSLLFRYFDPANIVMLFLLTVVLVAVAFGRGPAVLAAFLSVASFDWFFVPPRMSLAVSEIQYLLTFAVMLVVGLITGRLTAGLRYQARVARHREERSRGLYEFARELSSLLHTEDVVARTADFIGRTFEAKVALLIPDVNGKLITPQATPSFPVDLATAQWGFDNAQPAGAGTDTLPGNEYLYLPLRAPMRTRGVLAIRPESKRLLLIPEQRRQLDTFAALVAIALERVHYVDVAQQALVRIESERLRNSLLSALSHDLRTPLAALFGLADSLALNKPALSEQQLQIAQAIREAARSMSGLVSNLLDMARIQSGEVKPNLQWQPFEEVVGSALRATQALLANHRVELELDQQLPLVEFDAVLIERVLCNLLENAAKYTPPGSMVRIGTVISGRRLLVTVTDNGPGLPAGQEEQIFEKFTRGERESATAGVGLGLAICRAIIDAHGGEIWAEDNPAGGAKFSFTLPLGTPPEMPTDVRDPSESEAAQL